MLDLLYYFRRNQVSMKLAKDHIITYKESLKAQTGITFFDTYVDSFNYETGTSQQLIDLILAELKPMLYSCKINRAGSLLAVNKGIGEISRIIASRHDQNVSVRGGTKATYIFHYAKWVYTALEEIASCIAYNGSISNLEYVGIRTNEYLKTLNLENQPKRFGYPNDRYAYPIAFTNGAFSLSSPPMTTATHSRAYIKQVYNFFGYENFFEIKIGKTNFTRTDAFRVQSDPLYRVSDVSKISDKVRTYRDLNPSYVYDLFLSIYIKRLTRLEINEDLVFSSFPSTLSGVIGYDDNYLSHLKLFSDVHSLAELITMVY